MRAASSSAAGRGVRRQRSAETVGAGIDRPDALLLGRRTYDTFAGYRPVRRDDDPIAVTFNAVLKFVLPHTLTDPSCTGTTVPAGVATEVRAHGDRLEEVHVFGSGNLVTTLLREDLVDRPNFMVHPLVPSSGRHIFGDGTTPGAFTLVRPPQAFPKGALSLVYERDGAPVTRVDASQSVQWPTTDPDAHQEPAAAARD